MKRQTISYAKESSTLERSLKYRGVERSYISTVKIRNFKSVAKESKQGHR